MRRHFLGAGLRLVAIHHDLDQVAHGGRQRLGIEQLRRHRIDVAEIVDIGPEGVAQLVDLAVARAVADQHLEAQAGLARLAQEQRDVRVVAGVQDNVGARAPELGHQRGKIRCARRVAFPEHDLIDAARLALRDIRLGDAGAVRSVLVDHRDLEVLGIDAELGLGMLREERRTGFAVLIGMNLCPEHVVEVLALEHRGGDGGGNPKDLFPCLELGGERHRMRARIDAENDVDVFLVDQALRLIDGHVGLALGIGLDRLDLVFAEHAAVLVGEIHRDLRADRARQRPGRRERAGQIVEHADPDRFFLRPDERGHAQERARRNAGRRELEHGTPCLHGILPM